MGGVRHGLTHKPKPSKVLEVAVLYWPEPHGGWHVGYAVGTEFDPTAKGTDEEPLSGRLVHIRNLKSGRIERIPMEYIKAPQSMDRVAPKSVAPQAVGL